MDHPRPNLRYVAAGDLADSGISLKGLEVDGSDGEKLGKVDGFIIDISSGRPYHVVVAAGGWFTHKYFLLPIGHAILNGDATKLSADITKDRVKRFPGFDRAKFESLAEEELKALDQAMTAACCPDEVLVVTTWEVGSHYRYPDWWKASYYPSPVADRRR
jgi:sporulation protein YlmC with PRC-barrel domain